MPTGGEEDGTSCAICMEPVSDDHDTTHCPAKHAFHTECLIPWLRSNPTCPTCRVAVSVPGIEPLSTTLSIAAPEAASPDIVMFRAPPIEERIYAVVASVSGVVWLVSGYPLPGMWCILSVAMLRAVDVFVHMVLAGLVLVNVFGNEAGQLRSVAMLTFAVQITAWIVLRWRGAATAVFLS